MHYQNQQVISPSSAGIVTTLTDESKYFTWSFQIEMLLKSKSLWNYIIYSSAMLSELFALGDQGGLTKDATPEQADNRALPTCDLLLYFPLKIEKNGIRTKKKPKHL